MKEIKTKKEKMNIITTHVGTGSFYDVTSYQTADGKIFEAREDAEFHENLLRYKSLRKAVTFLLDEELEWFLPITEEELDFLKAYIGSCGDTLGGAEITLGVPFTYLLVDGGDSRNNVYYISFENLQNDFQEIEKQLKLNTTWSPKNT